MPRLEIQRLRHWKAGAKGVNVDVSVSVSFHGHTRCPSRNADANAASFAREMRQREMPASAYVEGARRERPAARAQPPQAVRLPSL
eukprot:6998226-Prymnesium_polylepis.3